MTAPPTPFMKMTYFDAPGRVEILRLMCAYGDLLLDDNRVDVMEWFTTLKAQYHPLTLPQVEINGVKVGQSQAVIRFVATKVGLYPSDPLEQMCVDEVLENVSEITRLSIESCSIPDIVERNAYQAHFAKEGGDLYNWVAHINKGLEGRDFAVGNTLTVADLNVFTMLLITKSGYMTGLPADWLEQFKNVGRHCKMVASLPKVKAYYANAEGFWAVYKTA